MKTRSVWPLTPWVIWCVVAAVAGFVITKAQADAPYAASYEVSVGGTPLTLTWSDQFSVYTNNVSAYENGPTGEELVAYMGFDGPVTNFGIGAGDGTYANFTGGLPELNGSFDFSSLVYSLGDFPGADQPGFLVPEVATAAVLLPATVVLCRRSVLRKASTGRTWPARSGRSPAVRSCSHLGSRAASSLPRGSGS